MLAFRALRGWWERLVGLLGTGPGASPVALFPCSSVHTLGMRYAIDVALVADDGLVLASRRGVGPGCVVTAPGARYALERPTSDAPWPVRGAWVRIDG